MATQTGPSTLPSPPDTRLGLLLRVGFFLGSVVVCLSTIPSLLGQLFGVLIAATVGYFATGFFSNLLVMQIYDRRPLADIGLSLNQKSIRNFALGLLCGAGTAGLMLLAPLLAGTGHLVLREGGSFAWTSLLFYLVTLLFGAAGEELIFRGYAFQLLVEKMGPFATVLPVGILFGMGHWFNPHATDLAIVNTSLWGILLGYAFLRSHDLWLPIGLHYGWNAVLPLFGVNLSGLTIDVTRYQYRWDLADIWSGGTYGPEGGLLTTIFAVALFFVLMRAPVAVQTAAIARSLNEPL